MSEQDKCPQCGAEFDMEFAGLCITWMCGTTRYRNGNVFEGNECLRRQLDRAQAENERLKRYELECENASEELQKYRDGLPVGLLCITEAIKQLDVLALRQRVEQAEAACAAMTETFRAYRNVSGLLGRCCGEYDAMQAADRFRESLDHVTNPGQPILDRLKTAEAIIAKLPKDAEDNPLAPGVVRWTMEGIEVRIGAIYDDGLQVAHVGHATILEDHSHDEEWDEYAYELYPTREAALAAKENP